MNSDEQQSAQQLLARLVAIQEEALRNQRMMMQEQQRLSEMALTSHRKSSKTIWVFMVILIALLVVPWLLNAGLLALSVTDR